MLRKLLALLLALVCLALPCVAEVLVDGQSAMTEDAFVEYGYDYYAADEVALYLHVFCELPPNYMTKDEARELGWSGGDLWRYMDGMCIGGDYFGNREGILPEDAQYYECDVNYDGGSRGAERLVFSEYGEIYYTGDHYESFDMLYDGWYEGEVDVSSSDDYGWENAIGDLIGGLLG